MTDRHLCLLIKCCFLGQSGLDGLYLEISCYVTSVSYIWLVRNRAWSCELCGLLQTFYFKSFLTTFKNSSRLISSSPIYNYFYLIFHVFNNQDFPPSKDPVCAYLYYFSSIWLPDFEMIFIYDLPRVWVKLRDLYFRESLSSVSEDRATLGLFIILSNTFFSVGTNEYFQICLCHLT